MIQVIPSDSSYLNEARTSISSEEEIISSKPSFRQVNLNTGSHYITNWPTCTIYYGWSIQNDELWRVNVNVTNAKPQEID
jgi:hypothetical protein